METEEESDDDSEYSEASEDDDSEGTLFEKLYYYCLCHICIFVFHFLIYFIFPFILYFLIEEELGSSEESGKDWSDLEREAAEEDKERGDGYRDDYNSSKKKKASRRQSLSPSKDRYCIY